MRITSFKQLALVLLFSVIMGALGQGLQQINKKGWMNQSAFNIKK